MWVFGSHLKELSPTESPGCVVGPCAEVEKGTFGWECNTKLNANNGDGDPLKYTFPHTAASDLDTHPPNDGCAFLHAETGGLRPRPTDQGAVGRR